MDEGEFIYIKALQIVDKNGDSTVWADPFETGDEAIQEFESKLKDEGIEALVGLDHRHIRLRVGRHEPRMTLPGG